MFSTIQLVDTNSLLGECMNEYMFYIIVRFPVYSSRSLLVNHQPYTMPLEPQHSSVVSATGSSPQAGRDELSSLNVRAHYLNVCLIDKEQACSFLMEKICSMTV